jgi:long-chain-fatty-acid--CoA ligase ACSBG
VKRNKKWQTLNFEEYHWEATRFAKALLALGLPEFAGVNIIGFNAPEWCIAFNGTAFARCIPVGIYNTNNQEVCEFIAKHSGAKVVVAENKALASKYFKLLDSCDVLKIVIYQDEVGSNDYGGKLVSWEKFMASGSNLEDRRVD